MVQSGEEQVFCNKLLNQHDVFHIKFKIQVKKENMNISCTS